MKWPRWVALVVAFLALAVGCTASPPTPRPSPTATLPATARADTNPQPRSRVGDGGMVRIPLAALPLAWNPWHPRGGAPESVAVRGPLSAPAFTFDAAGRPSPNPDYVTTATVTHTGHTRVVLALNERAVWSDGAEITATDWIATWQALRGTEPGYQVADDRGWREVTAVTQGTSKHQVVVEYAGVHPDWPRPLADGAARAESVRDAATFNGGWPEYQAGWFSGPFVVSHVDRAQAVITLDANPLWWGDRPKLEHVVFRRIQPEALAAAFQHNEFDVLNISSPAQLTQARASADVAIRQAPGTSGRLLRVGTTGVLADEGLRVALLRALDRTAIAAAAVGTVSDSPVPWGNQLLLANQPGYVDQSIATGLGHDRAAAADRFSRAGWPLVEGHRSRDGTRLALTMAVPADDPWARAEFGVIAATLADLGVTLTQATGDAVPDLVPETVAIGAFPLASVRSFDDPTLADLTGRVASEVDAVRRSDLAAQLSRRLWERVATIPLYQPPQTMALRNGLANLGPNGFATVRWQDVGWAR